MSLILFTVMEHDATLLERNTWTYLRAGPTVAVFFITLPHFSCSEGGGPATVSCDPVFNVIPKTHKWLPTKKSLKRGQDHKIGSS